MLVASRDKMLERFIQGEKPLTVILVDYRKNRNSEEWRISVSVEELCEYILYLESERRAFSYDIRT
jgi:hypothetical protein